VRGEIALINALIVRPAMREHVGHPLERFSLDRLSRVGPNGSRDAAHIAAL